MTSLVQRNFGRSAADYATSAVHAHGESLGRIVELARPQPHWRALDVGTGAGHLALAFAPHVAHVIASDITAEMRDQAMKLAADRGLTNVSAAHGDAGSLPFGDAAFDLVCSRLAAHHFPDQRLFLQEAARVLRPGGVLALVDNVAPDAATVPGLSVTELPAAVLDYNAFEKIRDASHGFAPPPDEWVAMAQAAGLNVIAREQLSKEIDFAGWIARMRCDDATIARLSEQLARGPASLRTFLRPRADEHGHQFFTLQELLLIAGKA